MSDTAFWVEVTASCPENGELADIIRRLGGFRSRNALLDREETWKRSHSLLEGFRVSCERSQTLALKLVGARFDVGGDEHHLVRVEDDPGRIYKVTYGDAFGCYSRFTPHDPECTGRHFHASINEDPVYYLQRWMLINVVTRLASRFEGVLPPQPRLKLPRICISQPMFSVRNPSAKEVNASMQEIGFRKLCPEAFMHDATGILLTDAAPRNVRIQEGKPIPFDAIASLAPDQVSLWSRV